MHMYERYLLSSLRNEAWKENRLGRLFGIEWSENDRRLTAARAGKKLTISYAREGENGFSRMTGVMWGREEGAKH